jgi:putative hemolysin
MMMRIISIATTLISIFVAVTGCTSVSNPQVQLANPASVACVKAGGRLSIISTPQGERGMCHLPSGEVCDEWDLFRQTPWTGTCPPVR